MTTCLRSVNTLPFDDVLDNDLSSDEGEREEDYYYANKQWEYYDLQTQWWKPYPKLINQGIDIWR
jgi:hypothetical protein